MTDFFASLYEWFGLMPLYNTDMGDLLRGWDITCTGFIGTPWYVYIGWIMIIFTGLIYALLYHIIDSPRWMKKSHWWLFALLNVILNFLIAFTIPFNIVTSGDYCVQLILSVSDCIGFGFSNALWGFILFIIISSIPYIRQYSRNCRNTTFWKP